MYFIKFHKRAGDSLAGYALVLGIITLVFVGMNTYIKSGFQGKMKEMSDRFVSGQHAEEIGSATATGSLSNTTIPKMPVTKQLLSGGVIPTGISDETRIEIQKHSITRVNPLSAPQEVKR